MKNKKMIILMAITLGILAYNLFFSAIQLADYNKRKQEGNRHWQMVGNEIVTMQNDINSLKNEVNRR
ncbi:MAG: hypothetical protein ACLTPN_02720 [Clostridia bacterium]